MKGVLEELIGLFVDDGFLAAAIVVIVAIATALRLWLSAPSMLVGAVLLVGCGGILVASVFRARVKS
jgi:hypothetical protein